MNTNVKNLTMTDYFGLPVEIVHKMESCSVIRFGDRNFIVDTGDLVAQREIMVKRQFVCKWPTIEREGGSSNGTQWFEQRKLNNDRWRSRLRSLPLLLFSV
jgi:hypothetical protein